MDQNIFEQTGIERPDYNTFDMSCTLKTSLSWGRIIPTHMQVVYPGDSIDMQTTHMIKTLPMVAPPMHDFEIITHNWYVPFRTLDPNWEDYINGVNPNYVLPFISLNAFDTGSVADYMGLPVGKTLSYIEEIMAYPFLAYNKIWNENYRDQNLQTERIEQAEEGNMNAVLMTTATQRPIKCAWQHDYFTSCLPFPQKGPEVTLPLGTVAPILFDNFGGRTYVDGGANDLPGGALEVETGALARKELFVDNNTAPANLDNSENLVVNLEAATAATIADLRLAEALQKYYELNARAGTRYPEYIKAHFGEEIKDYRINYSEYLGGGKSKLAISEVLQQSETGSTPQGTQAGNGYGIAETNKFKFKVDEWGIVMQLTMIVPKAEYKDGIDRWWSVRKHLDWYIPTFAHIGEQEVLRKELYVDEDETINNGIFGYQSRNADLRFNNNKVTGELRNTLAFWTCTRVIPDTVTLNETFIQCTPNDIIWPVQDDSDKFIAYFDHRIYMGRKMPLIAIPSLL